MTFALGHNQRTRLAIILAVLLIADLAQLIPVTLIRAVLAAPASFVLPGLTVWLILHRKREIDLGFESLVASTVLTIAIWPLLVLGLGAVSIQVTHASILGAFNGLVLLLVVALVLSERGAGAPSEPASDEP